MTKLGQTSPTPHPRAGAGVLALLRRGLPSLALAPLLAAGIGASIGGGCGDCSGAIRLMSAQQSDCTECSETADERVVIEPEESFRLTADGPSAESDELVADASIDGDAWFLIDEASGEAVPATISGDSGGHVCRNGVGFSLVPDEPLAPGKYTLVLLLDAIDWPLNGDHAFGQESTYGGALALVREFVVDA